MIKLPGCVFVTFLTCLPGQVYAIDTVEPSIHPELKAHTEHFAKKVYKVTERVYSALLGYFETPGSDPISLTL